VLGKPQWANCSRANSGTWLCTVRCVILIPMKNDGANADVVFDSTADIDRTLLRENLKLSFEQRAQKHLGALQMVEELRRAGKKLRQKNDDR
jgi:hypothetical protein